LRIPGWRTGWVETQLSIQLCWQLSWNKWGPVSVLARVQLIILLVPVCSHVGSRDCKASWWK
jgi:hypothetical protein